MFFIVPLEIIFFNLHFDIQIAQETESLAYVPERVCSSFRIIKQNFNPERTFKATRLWNKVICSTHIAALWVCDKIPFHARYRDRDTEETVTYPL